MTCNYPRPRVDDRGRIALEPCLEILAGEARAVGCCRRCEEYRAVLEAERAAACARPALELPQPRSNGG